MPVVQMLLLTASLGFLVFGIYRAVRFAGKTTAPTYPEPALQLEEAEQPHDVFGELASTLEADADADERYLEAKGNDRSGALPVAGKLLATGATAWGLVLVPYLVPGLARYRVLQPQMQTASDEAVPAAGGPLPSASVGEAKLPGATMDQQNRANELEAPLPDSRGRIAQSNRDKPKIAPAVEEKKPPRSIDDPSGKALDKFFAKLVRVENKETGAQARILYFGDSIVASDFVTGKMRRMLHDRFGDAGHGFAIVANAWPGWFHIDVKRQASAEWGVSTCVGPYAKDGLYGLGCASFTARNPGVWTEIGTATKGKWGREASRFEIEYLKQPEGGSLKISIDGEERETLDTAADETTLAYHTVTTDKGAHRLRLESLNKKPVRMFGMRMERDDPGVILSAMGITGARARFLDKQDDAHFAKVLKAAKPDLVCLAFGSNEITDGQMYSMEKYRETLTLVMEQIEKAVPDASLMLVGPPDMASQNPTQGYSRAVAPIIVKNQIKLAEERGWAFWNQYRAMGGAGSMWSWIQSGLGSQDMFHPTGQGGNLLGRWEYLALMEAFEKYKAARR